MRELWPLPSSWVWTKIGDVSDVVGGGTPSTNNPANFDGDIPWITPADLSGYEEKHIKGGARTITKEGYEASGAKWLPKGSVLFSSRAPIGYVAIASVAVTTNQGFKSFVLPSGIEPDYLYYWLRSAKRYAEDLASGTTFKEISGAKAALIPLPLAPHSEQTRIVAKLEELLSDLDAGVAELKAAQKKLQQYRQSLLKAAVEGALTADWREAQRQQGTPTETGAQLLARILTERRARWEAKQLAKFKEQGKVPPKDWQDKYPEPAGLEKSDLPVLPLGWVWATVEQLGETTTGFTPPTSDSKNFSGTIPFIKPTDLDSGYSVVSSRETLSELGASIGRVLPPKSVLVTCIGATIGKTGLARVACATNQQINSISTADGGPLPEFLYWMLVSGFGQNQIVSNASATTLPILNKSKFERIPLPLPSLLEQREIVSTLEVAASRLGDLNEALASGFRYCNAQRQNLLRAAFAGQLVSQDPTDEQAGALLERIRVERAEQSAQPRSRKTKKYAEA